MITLKEHNVKPYGELCAMLATHQKCAYVAATGTGKSYVVGKYIEDRELVGKTLVLVPSRQIKAGWKALIPGIDVVTYAGLKRCLSETQGKKLIVCDEMHHLGAERWGHFYQSAIEDYTGTLIGITATPVRFLDHGRNMADECFDGNIVEGVDLPTAISLGILPSFEYITALYNMPARMPNEKKHNKYTDQLFRQLDFMRSSYTFENILKKHLDPGGRKIVVFVNRIENIEEIRRMCEKLYPNAGHYTIHSGIRRKSEQAGIMNDFATDDRRSFLYTVDMLNEGVHVKGVDCIIMFRRTESPAIYLQQLGRALNADMAGKRIKVFDFVANHKNLKTVQEGSGSVINWIRENITNKERQIVVCDYAMDELEVLDKINAIIGATWTAKEVKMIQERYNFGKGLDELHELMPHRTRLAIEHKAQLIGVGGKKPRKPPEYFDDLRELFLTEGGIEKLKEKYPGSTDASLITAARRIGLVRHEAVKVWTDEELKIIKDNPEKTPKELMVLLPGRTKGAIGQRKAALGIKCGSPKWTEEECEILRKHADLFPSELHKNYLTNRSIQAIAGKKADMKSKNLI